MDTIFKQVTDTVSSMKETVTESNQAVAEFVSSVTDTINEKQKSLYESLRVFIDNEFTNNMRNQAQVINNLRIPLADIQRVTSEITKTSTSLLNSFDQLVDSITDIKDNTTKIEERVNTLEHPPVFPKPRFTKDEVREKVKDIIRNKANELRQSDKPVFLTDPEVQKEIYDEFQKTYGFERIEFLTLKRIISSLTDRFHACQWK